MTQRAELIINNVPEYAKDAPLWIATLDKYNRDQAWYWGAYDTDEEVSNAINQLGREDVVIVHNKGVEE